MGTRERMDLDVDIIIVAHDSGELLLSAVGSAAAEVGEARTWVVDAESRDGSLEAVAQRYPGVHVLPVRNKGFSANNNRGIEATSGRYVMLLNPDARVHPGSVAALVAAMEATPDAGIVAPLVRNPDGTMQAGSFGRFPTLAVRVRIGIQRWLCRLVGAADAPNPPTERRTVDWVTGAAMLVRREAIAVAGPMDEAFFLYYEDIDWCHRMWDRGWRVLIEPTATVTHHVGHSGGSGPRAAAAYRDSFDRYCDIYGLSGLRLAGRIGVALRAGRKNPDAPPPDGPQVP